VGELPTSFFSLNERIVTKGNCPKRQERKAACPKEKKQDSYM
jgi:hypothetical protein